MEQVIREYLIEHKTLILPQLGALTITNEDTNEIMFMSYLKYDDKKLATAWAENQRISIEQAADEVSNWIQNIINKLNQGENVPIADLGYLTQNSLGDIDFSSDLNINTTEIKDVNLNESLPNEPEIEIPIVEEEVISEEIQNIDFIPEEIHETTIEETISSPQNEIDAPEIIDETPFIIVPDDVFVEENYQQTEENETTDEVSHTIESHPVEEKKKSGLKIFLIILTSIIILLGLAITFMYDDLKEKLPFLQEQTFNKGNTELEKEIEKTSVIDEVEKALETIQTEDDIEQVEDVVKIEIPVEKKVIHSTSNTTSTGNYFVIVGSFQDENNAINLVEKLNSEGHSATIAGKSSGLHLVAIGQYSTQQDAQAKVKEVGNCWIFKK